MKRFALLFLTSCSAPFTSAPTLATQDDAATDAQVSVPDAPEPDSGTPDAALEASEPDTFAIARPDAQTEAAPETHDADAAPETHDAAPEVEACAPILPYTLISMYCPASCGFACSTQNAPETIGSIILSTARGCGAESTPAECQTCGTYNCECILSHLTHVQMCGDGSTPTCNSSAPMPTLVCP